MKHVATLLAAGLVALILGGCTLFEPHVHDLTLVSVRVVPPRVVQAAEEAGDDSPLLQITLRTKTDFVDIVQGEHFNDFTAYLVASACTKGQTDKSKDMATSEQIFYPGGEVSGHSSLYKSDPVRYNQYYPAFRQLPLKEYTVFIPVRHVRLWPNDPIPASFDLEQNPQDVCLAVAGGVEGLYYQTNTVVVPRAAITAALAASQAGR